MLVSTSDGVRLAVHDVGGDGPPLLLSHATGFHGWVFGPMAAHLRGRFHCWAPDHRWHGDSDAPPDDQVEWSVFAVDALAIADALDLHAAIGFGHSMGGSVLLMAHLAQPETFAGLVLFEPIAFPPEPISSGRVADIISGARRRRAVFSSRADAFANYVSKPPLNVMTPEALQAYVDHGFVDQDDGSVRLRCDPEHEALIFEAGARQDLFSRLGEVDCPVLVVAGSAADNPPGAAAAIVAEAIPGGRFTRLEALGHLGPMQDPASVAALVVEFAGALG